MQKTKNNDAVNKSYANHIPIHQPNVPDLFPQNIQLSESNPVAAEIENISNKTYISHIPSFTVLNRDNLNTKPNAIVLPIRRPGPVPGLFDDSQQTSASISLAASKFFPTILSRNGQEMDNFVKELNRKLRRLHEGLAIRTKSPDSIKNGNNQDSVVGKRPLFITTVPTGVFLPPSKEPPLPPVIRRQQRVYAFSSRPIILNNSSFSKDMVVGGFRINIRDKQLAGKLFHEAGGDSIDGERDGKGRGKLEKTSGRDDLERYRNLMCDRRVVRGTNYKQHQILAKTECAKKVKDLKCRQKPRNRNLRNVIGTPPPVPGRCHERVQTEKYLEELFDRPPEMTVNTQTDLFLEQPLTPPYIPGKIGIDVYTEIEDGELFDFDAEVEPIVETLVGHCVQQGLLEVSHEEEVAELEKQQQEFLAKRQADLAEIQRLEAEELRLQAEKDRRLRQDAIAKELDKEMEKGVTAAKLLQGHIASLLPEVLENLEPVSDAVKKEKLEKTICPWLTQEVAEEVGHIVDCREVLTLIIEEIIKQRATIYGGYSEPCDEKPFTVQGEEEEEAELECNVENM